MENYQNFFKFDSIFLWFVIKNIQFWQKSDFMNAMYYIIQRTLKALQSTPLKCFVHS